MVAITKKCCKNCAHFEANTIPALPTQVQVNDYMCRGSCTQMHYAAPPHGVASKYVGVIYEDYEGWQAVCTVHELFCCCLFERSAR